MRRFVLLTSTSTALFQTGVSGKIYSSIHWFIIDLLFVTWSKSKRKQQTLYILWIITGVSNDTVSTLVGDLCARCPDACDSRAFDIEMSYATLSSLSAQDLLSNKERTARLTKNFKVSKKCKKCSHEFYLHLTLTSAINHFENHVL